MTDNGRSLPRKVVGAGVLCTDPTGRVLLVEPVYKDNWEIPGGVVEAGETPFDGAAREVTEELGLTLAPGRLLVVDWSAKNDGIMFVFDGGVLDGARTAEIVLQAAELRGWAWCTPEMADERLSAPMARRIAAARTALTGTTRYLQDGFEIMGE